MRPSHASLSNSVLCSTQHGGGDATRTRAGAWPGASADRRDDFEDLASTTCQIQQLGQTEYPETQALLNIHGVGHLTALTFVLTLGSKGRFSSRDVGCYLGLRPTQFQSGEHDPQLGITHAGERLSPEVSADRVFEPHPSTTR